MDTGEQIIARSLQLIAGRTAQEYNLRKQRKGAYWEDRYHATLVATDRHFVRCLVYIDLNMVRAGVVKHPVDWLHGGYREIQSPPQRYRIIDTASLMSLTGIKEWPELQQQHRLWVDEAIASNQLSREPAWTETLAVGDESFVQEVQTRLGAKALRRTISTEGNINVLRELPGSYDINSGGKIVDLSSNNRLK